MMSEANKTAHAWQQSKCKVAMWSSGAPSGLCGEKAFGEQLPSEYLANTRGNGDRPYCFGHACPSHGGPKEDEIRIFSDGFTEEGRQMWCAVMSDFENLQESHAGFDGNPVRAAQKLRAAIAKATGQD
jgi:hypothetical protein